MVLGLLNRLISPLYCMQGVAINPPARLEAEKKFYKRKGDVDLDFSPYQMMNNNFEGFSRLHIVPCLGAQCASRCLLGNAWKSHPPSEQHQKDDSAGAGHSGICLRFLAISLSVS